VWVVVVVGGGRWKGGDVSDVAGEVQMKVQEVGVWGAASVGGMSLNTRGGLEPDVGKGLRFWWCQKPETLYLGHKTRGGGVKQGLTIRLPRSP
jgi:hypothetical protein